MGLQVIVIQEVPEEVADQESEASLKVSDEDHTLICFCCRQVAGMILQPGLV
jgi:hypothetical protein